MVSFGVATFKKSFTFTTKPYQIIKIMNVKLLTGVLFLSAAIIASCGSKEEKKDEEKKAEEPWSEEYKTEFNAKCLADCDTSLTEEMKNELCNCSLEKLMANFKSSAEMENTNEMEVAAVWMECLSDEMLMKISGEEDTTTVTEEPVE